MFASALIYDKIAAIKSLFPCSLQESNQTGRVSGAEFLKWGAEMDDKYEQMAKVFRALSDPKRIKIVNLLSCGELCACVLLKCFEITQPTLSHDMKVLSEAGIVESRREGKRVYYSLNLALLSKIQHWLTESFQKQSDKSPAQ